MTEPVSIKLGKTMKQKLRALADADRRTLSAFIAHILEDWLEQHDKPKRGGK